MAIIQTMDFIKVAKLNKTVHNLHYELYPNVFKPYDYAAACCFIEQAMKNPENIFLLVEDDEGNPQGFVWFEIRVSEENPFKRAQQSLYVHQLSVQSENQGKGYGTQLMTAVYEEASTRGIDWIELDYWVDNTVAKKFYDKLGFQTYRRFVHKKI
ncbi:N-acetyltransferase [Bacillaceae bacterium S4-13-56]